MTIAIIGAGRVGQALAKTLVDNRIEAVFGVADPAAKASLAGSSPMPLLPLEEAVDRSEIVIVATPYAAALQLARDRRDWGGRILVDVTNPLYPDLSGLTIGTGTSAAEQIAAAASNARVVKAFNTTGFENMADPRSLRGNIFMPVASDDTAARAQVVALATRMGFDAVDVGPLAAARYMEPFAMLWIHMAFKLGHARRFAFARVFPGDPQP